MPLRLVPNPLARLSAGLGLSVGLLVVPLAGAAEQGPVAPAASAVSQPVGQAIQAAQATSRHGGHARRPQLALDARYGPDGWLWLVELDDAGRLVLQTSGDDGRHWSEPQVLDTAGDVVAAQGEQRPKLAFGPDGVVVIAYTQPLAKPYTGAIRLLRSTDGGRTFAPPVTVHTDRQIITHRFESIGFDARGRLHVVWIDKRDGEAVRAAGGDPKSYRGAAIYHAISTDGGGRFGADLRLAEHSCECCRIAVAPTPDGSLVALWRHVFAPNERDHGFARLDGETPVEPVRATLDHWALDACPHHGPALAPAEGGGYHAVWYGVRDGVAAVRYGRLDADGHPVGAARALPDEAAEHADIASIDARVAIVWRSFDGSATRLRAWLSNDGGATFAVHELGRRESENDYGRLLVHDGRFEVIWRSTEGVDVIVLPF